jgi:TRIAD3 protein (E3 ubiquitin-protein ligase RNF216)
LLDMLDVIDLSSSPEPTRALAALTAAANKSKRAGKAKAIPGPIFDLTNSDDDDDDFVLSLPPAQETQNVAGPSSSRQEIRFDASSSFVNIPGQSTKANGTSTQAPLFLPSDDEENRPPQRTLSPDLEMIHPSQPPTVVFDVPEGGTQSPLLVENFEPDPESATVARVLEIIPDVEPDHLLALVRKHAEEHPAGTLVEHILHMLFEDSSYPRVDRKGKRKKADVGGDGENGVADGDDGNATCSKKTKIDYATKSRPFTGGAHYADLALVRMP